MSTRWQNASLPLPETDAQQAPFLAGLLRASRLTVLYGSAGAGKTALLARGVMPLLRRRLVERPAARAAKFFSARQARASGARMHEHAEPEIGVFFDAWDSAPWAGLQAVLRDALAMPPKAAASPLGMAQTLATWTEDRDARLLIVLDRFEDCLLGAARRPDLRAFADELVRAVNRPDLPVNFLVALRDEAEPLMARLCHRIPGFDPHRLELSGRDPAGRRGGVGRLAALKPGQPRDDSGAAESLSQAQRQAAWTSPRTAEVYAAIDSMLARTAAAARGEPAFALLGAGRDAAAPGGSARAEPPVLLDAQPAAGHAPARAGSFDGHEDSNDGDESEDSDERDQRDQRDDLHSPDDESPLASTGPSPRARLRKGAYWLAVPAALAGLLFLVDPAGESGDAPAPAGPAAAVPQPPPERQARADRDAPPAASTVPAAPPTTAPTPPPAPAPSATPAPAGRLALAPATAAPAGAAAALQVSVDLDAAADMRMARELARGLARPAGLRMEVLPSVDRTATLAALDGGAGLAVLRYDALQAARTQRPKVALEIVTPLYTEAIHFLVRADSPLRFIHQIEDSRINTGPAQSAGALTAAAVYRRLFGKALPAAQADRLPPEAALQSLTAGRGLDVMVSVGPPPAGALADDATRGLRLLELDPEHPASRRALQAFLPASARQSGAPAAPATPTLGVMSFLVAADQSGDDAALGRFASDLCRALPALRREGDPKWRQFQPGLQLDVGWPYSQAAAEGFSRECPSPLASSPPAPSKER